LFTTERNILKPLGDQIANSNCFGEGIVGDLQLPENVLTQVDNLKTYLSSLKTVSGETPNYAWIYHLETGGY